MEPVTEPVKEPVNEPVNEPVKEPVNEPVREPVREPVIQLGEKYFLHDNNDVAINVVPIIPIRVLLNDRLSMILLIFFR